MRKLVSLAVFLLVLGVSLGCKPKVPAKCIEEGKIWLAENGDCVQCEAGIVVVIGKDACEAVPDATPTEVVPEPTAPPVDVTPTLVEVDPNAAACKEATATGSWQCRNSTGRFVRCPIEELDRLPGCETT